MPNQTQPIDCSTIRIWNLRNRVTRTHAASNYLQHGTLVTLPGMQNRAKPSAMAKTLSHVELKKVTGLPEVLPTI